MSIAIHLPNSRKAIKWASGTSTEIFIHPSDGSFAERDFLFRISTATVEAEESIFSFFEGITRHLMILKGGLDLIHEGRYERYLKPYEQDTFSGEWNTRSKGKVTDFNLMLKGAATGSMAHHPVEAGSPVTFVADSDFYFVYVAVGSIVLESPGVANAGDLLQVSKGTRLQLEGEGDLIVISVRLD